MAEQTNDTGEIRNPKGITETDIAQLKDAGAARKKSKEFAPPVSMSKCSGLVEMQERLRVALRKSRGEMRDLQAFGQVMAELKSTDGRDRHKLMKLFAEMEKILKEPDEALNKQLQMEDITKDYMHRLQHYKRLMKQEECPVLVVGQTSSGKSSLLNLFLGAEYLPSMLLSCTASICELNYGEQPAAKVVYDGGKEEVIDFDKKNEYIYKKDERDRRFDHEAVKLSLPVPFLRSGIVLIDTPGIGESESMDHVLLDYVKKKDAFGFIFVLKCNDAGGVLQRFKNLLRQLADIKDSEGRKKMDPKSVIFIANFWDQVPDDEKDKTRELIISSLMKEKCMTGFNAGRQLFFMNSKFAFNTWKAGLISEDFDKLIDGVQNFFPVGHKRKLEISYLWFENLIEKAFHPLKAYLAKAKFSNSANKKMTERNEKELQLLLGELREMKKEIGKRVKETLSDLKMAVTEYLQSEDAVDDILRWRPTEVPREEIGDTWILIEEKLDKAIDKRLSMALENWECDECHFADKSKELLNELDNRLEALKLNIKAVQKETVDISDDVDDGSRRQDMKEVDNSHPTLEGMQMALPASSKYGYKIPVSQTRPQNLLDTFTTKTANILRSTSEKYEKIREKNIEMYKKDKAQFMCDRAKAVLDYTVQSGKGTIDQMVEDQMRPITDYIDNQFTEVKQSIEASTKLLGDIGQDKRSKETLQHIYSPIEENLSRLFEETLDFRANHLLLYQYFIGDTEVVQRSLHHKHRNDSPWKRCGLFAEFSHHKLNLKGQHGKVADKNDVTLKRFAAVHTRPKDTTDPLMYYRDIFYHYQNLMSAKRFQESSLPNFLGLSQFGPSFAFAGSLKTAASEVFKSKSQLLQGHMKDNQIKMFNYPILEGIGKGLEFLHLRRLVHMDLSLETVFVKDGQPILVNLFDSQIVHLPHGRVWNDKRIDNYLYMPPEVFPRVEQGRYIYSKISPYTSYCDMYALGMISIELLCGQDVFHRLKKDQTLAKYFESSSHIVKFVRDIMERSRDEYKIHPSLVQLALKCVTINPEDRVQIGKFNEIWRQVKYNSTM